jgi:hypothetical protein
MHHHTQISRDLANTPAVSEALSVEVSVLVSVGQSARVNTTLGHSTVFACNICYRTKNSKQFDWAQSTLFRKYGQQRNNYGCRVLCCHCFDHYCTPSHSQSVDDKTGIQNDE